MNVTRANEFVVIAKLVSMELNKPGLGMIMCCRLNNVITPFDLDLKAWAGFD